MSTLDRAIQLAATAHAGQVDKAGRPYMVHICHVIAGVQSDDEKIVAALHDIVEDTPVQLDELRYFFSPEVADAVEAITKKDGEDYQDYLERVSANELARAVKLVDLDHNANLARLDNITQKDFDRSRKYQNAIWFLRKQDYLLSKGCSDG